MLLLLYIERGVYSSFASEARLEVAFGLELDSSLGERGKIKLKLGSPKARVLSPRLCLSDSCPTHKPNLGYSKALLLLALARLI